MMFAPHVATAAFAVRDGLIWLMLTVVMGAHTARDLLQGRLGDGQRPPLQRAGDPD